MVGTEDIPQSLFSVLLLERVIMLEFVSFYYYFHNSYYIHLCCFLLAVLTESAAEQAALRKYAKCALLPATHMFVPVAFETLGPAEFLLKLGRRISSVAISSCNAFPSMCAPKCHRRRTFPDGCETCDMA